MRTNRKFRTSLTKLVLLSLSLLILPVQSFARDVTFVWTAVSEPIIGYKLYGQEGTKTFDAPVTLGKVTTYTASGLASDKIYHYYLTAYNQAGESEHSAIVTVPSDSSLAPIIISISLQ